MARIKGGKGKGGHICHLCGVKKARYALHKNDRFKRCRGCKRKWDIDVVARRCPCGHHCSFGPPGGKRLRCSKCRQEGDVNRKFDTRPSGGSVGKTPSPSAAKGGTATERKGDSQIDVNVNRNSEDTTPTSSNGNDISSNNNQDNNDNKRNNYSKKGSNLYNQLNQSNQSDQKTNQSNQSNTGARKRQKRKCAVCGKGNATHGPPDGRECIRCANCQIDKDRNNTKAMCTKCLYTRAGFGQNGAKTHCSRCRVPGDLPIGPKCETCGIRIAKFGPAGTGVFPRCSTCKIDGDAYKWACQGCFQGQAPKGRLCKSCLTQKK